MIASSRAVVARTAQGSLQDVIAGLSIFGVIAMMRIIQDLRIGTKLAITSGLTILVVAGMIYLQITGGDDVRAATDKAAGQQAIAQNAAEAKASVRGMQMGIRDILMATTPEELKKGDDYFADRTVQALKFNGEMAKLSKSPENRQRIERQKVLIEGLSRRQGSARGRTQAGTRSRSEKRRP